MKQQPITWESIRDRVLADPEVKAEYDALEAEFNLASRAIAIRASTGLNQREFAERVGMKQSQLARIESGKQIPKLETLAKLAAAAGYAVEVNFIPLDENRPLAKFLNSRLAFLRGVGGSLRNLCKRSSEKQMG